METLTIIILLALAATVLVLIQGIVSMVRGGVDDDENCEQIMATRIVVQGIAVALIFAALVINN